MCLHLSLLPDERLISRLLNNFNLVDYNLYFQDYITNEFVDIFYFQY